MTPNKLPPLPELIEKALKRAFCLGQTYWQQADSQYTSDHKRADVTMEKFKALTGETLESAEALRQPQSLPAGAVAGLSARVEFAALGVVRMIVDQSYFGPHMVGEGDEVTILKNAALQADARDKGEAAEEVETVIGRLYAAARHVDRAREKLPDSFNHQEHNDILDAIALIRRLATQPAQASEKDNG